MPKSILGSQEAGWKRTWESANSTTAAYSMLKQRVKFIPASRVKLIPASYILLGGIMPMDSPLAGDP